MSTIKILFDSENRPLEPTIILADKSGKKIAQLKNIFDLFISDSFSSAAEFTFKVSKQDNLKTYDAVWDKITDFKLIYCPEWDSWFEIKVELTDGTDIIKSITATALCESELSQILIFGTEINTENDIARDDYEAPTIIYDSENPDTSLLNRIMEKAPHYTIAHVDRTIAGLQRIFSFDNKSLKDVFDEIAEEIHALVIYGNGNSPETNKPARTVSLYDLEQTCRSCGYRGEFIDKCPECGGMDIQYGYGKDTTIFITKDNLTDEVIFSTDTDSVKNCFKLEAGDDLMTSVVRSCNPNGSSYLWYLSDCMKDDMPKELVEKINAYNSQCGFYKNNYIANIETDAASGYNMLIQKYKTHRGSLEELPQAVSGYSNIIRALYEAIDFKLYLTNSLMPDIEMASTSAALEAKKLAEQFFPSVAVSSTVTVSSATADSNILAAAKVLTDSQYQLKIKNSSFNKQALIWHGCFTVTNYSDENDTADTAQITVSISDNYEQFVRQKLDKKLYDGNSEDFSISELFKKEIIQHENGFSGDFPDALTLYSLSSLMSICDCCQSCIDVLIELGVGDKAIWNNSDTDLFEEFYQDYLNRLSAINAEISVREEEINKISALYDILESEKERIQQELDFETYLGEDLWKIFCSYRRDDLYQNTNYISDGLNNADLIHNALEFISTAEKEIYKSATLQHSISSTLKNLLVIQKFRKIVDYFQVGNWIRILVDGSLYKLRLLEYEIDYNNLDTINVEFSDVVKIKTGISDLKSVLAQNSSMATSYNSVKRQASKGNDVYDTLNNWSASGLDATLVKITNNSDNQDIVFDTHGLLFRKYDDVTEDYQPVQIKIINSTIAITNDNWQTIKTAIGNILYRDPATGELTEAYGVNADIITGRMIIGENLCLSNLSGTLKFDNSGFTVTSPGKTKTFSITNDGDVYISGTVSASDGNIAGWTVDNDSIYKENAGMSSNPDKYAFWAGGTGSGTNTKFRVTHSGSLFANDVELTGTITATRGKIANFTINGGYLTNGLMPGSPGSCGISCGSALGGSDDWVFWAGNGTYRVNKDGKAWMTDTSIKGGIDATTLNVKEAINIYTSGTQGDDLRQAIRWFSSDIACLEIGADFEQVHIYGYSWFQNDIYALKNFFCYGNIGCDQSITCQKLTCLDSITSFKTICTQEKFAFSGDATLQKQIYCIWADGSNHNLIAVNNGLDFYFGWNGSSDYQTRCILRGQTVLLKTTSGSAVTSDERLKNSFKPLDEFDDVFMSIEPCAFKYNDGVSGRYHFGAKAQQIREAFLSHGYTTQDFGGLVQTTDDPESEDYCGVTDPWSLIYTEFTMWNTHMIQKCMAENATLRTQNQRLSERLDALEQAVNNSGNS